jgi:hypothetical protein
MPRAAWGLTVLLVVAGLASPAIAQTAPLPPPADPVTTTANYPTEPVPSGILPPEPSLQTTPINKPPPILGAPVMGLPVQPADRLPASHDSVRVAGNRDADTSPIQGMPVSTGGYTGAVQGSTPPVGSRGVSLGRPSGDGVATAGGRTDPDLDSADPLNDLLNRRSAMRKQPPSDPDRDPVPPPAGRTGDRSTGKMSDFGDRIGDLFGKRSDWFRSDHAFDGFISPVTNPFLFEDPRSLTEVRPIFMAQSIPPGQRDFHGGSIWYFGTQARVAFTERWSFTLNKLGFISVNPGSGSGLGSQASFAELWLGPKYTFIRGEESGSLLAGGLQFQIPTGNAGTYQNTGSLSLVPYLTYGQNFGRDFSYGSFNALVGTGYSFSVNNVRSDYYYLSAHIDWDVMNYHRFYPLMEMNWFLVTTNGNARPIGIEGRDLIDFGGNAKGQGLLTWAIGGRYKISECAQIGAAFEIPVAGPRDLFNYRFTLDFILRY